MSVNVNSTSGLTTAAKYVGMWFTFKKMGIEGWRGIIPFYNMYVLFKKFLDVKSFVLYLVFRVCSIIGSVFGFIACYMGSIFLSFGVENRYSRDIEALLTVGVIAMIIGFLIVICAPRSRWCLSSSSTAVSRTRSVSAAAGLGDCCSCPMCSS